MVYVVERYLPGLCRTDLLPGLSKLELVIQELRGEGWVVRYLGSTIVLGDESCFCQFDGPSAAAVAEANRRAGLPFDRIVPALLVDSQQRRGEMSVSTSIPQAARRRRTNRLIIVAAVAAVVALIAWTIATYAAGPSSRPTRHTAPTQASVLGGLTPQERQHVVGILSLTPAQLGAAFGTDQPGDIARMRSLTTRERRYTQAIASMSPSELAAAFGAGPFASAAGSSGVVTTSSRGSSQHSAKRTTATPASGTITVRSTETLKSEDVTNGRVAGTGHFTISGAISDAGTVIDYRTVNGNRVLIRRVVAGEKGNITFLVTLDLSGPPPVLGHWRITSATKSYEGLHGSGKQTVDDFESSPATFALSGTVSQ